MKKQPVDIQIPVTIGGVTFKNPFFVASGPTTKTVEQLVRIEETGWAAASIKLSIDPAPYINRKPRYGVFKDRDALAFTTEKRLTFQQGLDLIREAKPLLHDLKLMANITYAGDAGVEGWVNMAKKFEEVGADIIELNMCCPNMSYNLELTSGGAQTGSKQTGASMGQNANIAAEIVSAVKKAISIPLFVKLTPEGGKIAQVAKSLFEAGADAVGGTGNRMGMAPINLDEPEKGAYHLQDESSMSCHWGTWLKPLAQRDTYEIRKVCGKEPPIMAAGGITNWRDAVEMILCGGNLIGVCAETLISGYDIVRPMIAGVSEYMERHGYKTVDDFRSKLVDEVKTATDVTLYAGYTRIKEPNLSAPCKSACPHHVPIQAYVQKIVEGDFEAAYNLITAKNALQGICGAVCAHPCEDACVRGTIDAPVKIRELKRFVLEYGKAQGWKPAWSCAESNGHKVAVIGAGPCGLACAAELVKGGYAVTVFDKEAEAGGDLRYGLPAYAGQSKVIADAVNELAENGVCFKFNTKIGTDVTLEELKAQGFEKVFAATGANAVAECSIPGFGIALDAKNFLYEVNCGKAAAFTGTVAVAGAGYAAINAARSALRLGAEKVILLYNSAAPKATGIQEALTAAIEEGVSLIENAAVTAIEEGKISFTRDGMELTVSCTKCILAGNYTASAMADTAGNLLTSSAKITNVISAITAGKEAAVAIDKMIRGDDATLAGIGTLKTVSAELVRKRNGYIKKNPNKLKLDKAPADRIADFAAYKRLMTEAEAIAEATRCLNCGCGEGCQLCKTICTDFAPEIIDQDTMNIRSEKCVACGMCYNRCPNGNIEMVNLGYTV